MDIELEDNKQFISNIPRIPVSILHKSIAGRYRPVREADGPITARCRFINNASWDVFVEKLKKNNMWIRPLIWSYVKGSSWAEVGGVHEKYVNKKNCQKY